MKNKILALAVVATVAVAGAWNFSQSNKELALSDLVLANVEALASDEGVGDCIIANCYWSSYEYCKYTCNGILYESSNMKNKS